MLFLKELKREFLPGTWKDGQVFYRQGRVRDVRLENDTVSAQVHDPDGELRDASIRMARSAVSASRCSCPEHRKEERHCRHIAALGIWVVERGSLLRLRVGGSDQGVAEGVKPAEDTRKIYRAEPVAFVRGFNQGKAFAGFSVETAVRFRHPGSGAMQLQPLAYMVKQIQPGIWRTSIKKAPEESGDEDDSEEIFLKLTDGFVPILTTLDSAKLIHQGPTVLEELAKVVGSEYRDRIVLHDSVKVELDPEPLRLASLRIGARGEKTRQLSYEFRNARARFRSEELSELGKLGRLGNHHVWKGDTLYRLGTSLALLSQYANRSGVAAPENEDQPRAAEAFGHLYDTTEQPLHPLSAYRLSLELGVDKFEVDDDWTEFHEWRRTFEKKRIAALPKVPYGFELRDYQLNGLSWLWSLYHRGLSALLADDMGLGKTHQLLALLTSIYRGRGEKPKAPSIVIAPTSVVAAWIQKLKRYDTGLKWHVFHGKSRSLPKDGVDLVLTTYGILQREFILRERDWHVVVLDEAQAIKNAGTISFRSARALRAKFRVAMTGTPVENQSTDLWALMEFLLPGYLGSLPRFKRLYGSGREGTSEFQASALKRLISPFLLRRTKSQVLKELPEKTEEIITCELTPVQKKAYRDYLRSDEAARARKELQGGGKVDYASILTLLTRLKQVCDHPRLPGMNDGNSKKTVRTVDPLESGKWEALDELVTEALGSGLKVVIFTQYLSMMDMIGFHLSQKEVGHVELRGDTPDRAARLEKFANDPECKVFICSLLAGGLGIDLTAASVCIHMDRWWNPAKENQATDRLHRIGQTRGVQVFKLMIPGTVEDRIASIIESKLALSGALIEESPIGLKSFSRQELLELLTEMD